MDQEEPDQGQTQPPNESAQTPAPPLKKRGGSRPGERRGGRKPGTKNKATVERERLAQLAAERERMLAEAEKAGDVVKATQARGKKLMKEIGFEFAQMFAGLAAYYQPFPEWFIDASGRRVNANPNYDQAQFEKFAVLAAQTARDFAPFESPRLAAMMVGQAVVSKVTVEGGMPDDFAAPAGPVTLAPGTIVTAEDIPDGGRVIEINPAIPTKSAAG